MALFVREVKQVVAGPWRPQWVGSLRELFAVPRMGTLFLLGFLFQVMWSGNVAIISIYVLQLLATQLAGAGAEAFWVGGAAMGLAPFYAGLIGPALRLRACFALTVVLMLGGLALWLRGDRANEG